MLVLLSLRNSKQYFRRCIGYFSIAIAYLFLFGWMLYASNGMPYVMDNNETYSSIIHAKSISQFGVSESKGLADESYGLSLRSHPYVHSHQGNYPRLFAWIIYELGAKNPIQQILITTFTVGLAAILLAFTFMSRIANPWFAFIFCIVLLSDYIFFSQWQIVTYRVWYSFVFFLQFFSIEQYLKQKKTYWIVLVFINTTLFCYGELIFAAFLGMFSFLWIVFSGWRDKTQIFLGGLYLIAGLFVAILTLVAQGIGYLGIDNFLRDIQLTFSSRNNFDSSVYSMEGISKFYQEHNVVFWENMKSRGQFIGLQPFISSIFSNFIKVYSPLVSIFFGILFLNYIVNLVLPKIYQSAANKLKSFQSNSTTFIVLSQYTFTSLTIACLIKTGAEIAAYYYGVWFGPWWLPILAIEIVISSWIITSLGSYAIFHFNLMALLAITISNLLTYLIGNPYAPYWIDIHGVQIIQSLCVLLPLIFVVSTLNSFKIKVSNNTCSSTIENLPPIPQVFKFIFAGLLAYTIIYFLSPGYVFTGYIERYAPFLVFVFDLCIAIAFYQLIYFIYSSIFMKASPVSQPFNDIFSYLALSLFLFVFTLWFGLQYRLIQVLPPTHFSVLERLSSIPYKDSSFIVNTYAAPVAVQTGQWAYMDSISGKALFINVKGEKRLLGDQSYIWLADKNTNDEYRRPDYFICLVGQDIGTVLRKITDKGNYKGCFDFPLVKLALTSEYANQELRLVEYDKLGERQSGVVTWAIIKFDWSGRLGNGLEWVKPSSIEQGR